ncbi:TPA: type II secretion system pilot lipoprotein GspS-beta [Salmonella enterica]|uniref:Type II secretion system pilot lipoprotein GspS-beta n=1 Tax=Salmonella enterica TaxID=28901 RepID=A0A759QQI5_SALER|nr:type II secretion system pilot lipoprotein GspS-beta [Salmonella enterica]
MSEKQIPGKNVIPALLSIVASLSGCAGYQSETEMLAKEQARNISMNLPVKSANYTLISAQSSGTLIKMTVISENNGQLTLSPDAFLTRFQYQICTDPAMKTMMNKGVNYIIKINEIRTGNQYQRKLDRAVCGITKI